MSTLVADIQSAFCRANCFCPNGWFQFADSFSKPKTRFAECVRFSSSPANWYGAKASCAMQAGGQAFMASELSKLKHDFHADYVRSIKGTVVPYLIGLTYESDVGQNQWDQTYSNGTHYSVRPNDYQPWFKDDGTDNLRAAVQVGSRGSDTYWFKVEKTSNNNQYMCQVDACDTDHYCDGGNAVVNPSGSKTAESLRTTTTTATASSTTSAATTRPTTPLTTAMATTRPTSARAEPLTSTHQHWWKCGNSSGAVPLYRAWKEGDRGDHFYTTSFNEWQNAIKNLGYKDEGITGRIFAHVSIGTVPLYRLYHRDVVDHFYTTSASEYDTAINRLGFIYEGVAGFFYPKEVCPGLAPLYRMYKPAIFDHFYTMSAAERDNASKQFGYTDEGIVAWIYPA